MKTSCNFLDNWITAACIMLGLQRVYKINFLKATAWDKHVKGCTLIITHTRKNWQGFCMYRSHQKSVFCHISLSLTDRTTNNWLSQMKIMQFLYVSLQKDIFGSPSNKNHCQPVLSLEQKNHLLYKCSVC